MDTCPRYTDSIYAPSSDDTQHTVRLCTVAELTKESHAEKVKCILLGDRAIESLEHGSLKLELSTTDAS